MSEDKWVIEVLEDMGAFAESKGYCRFKKSLENASGDFLADLKERHLEGASRLKLKRDRTEADETILNFPKKPGQ